MPEWWVQGDRLVENSDTKLFPKLWNGGILYGLLRRIRCCILRLADHRHVARGGRFATRGDPWRARFWNLGIKILTLQKKFIDFHQKLMIENLFLGNFSKSENQKLKMLIISVVIFLKSNIDLKKIQLELLTFSTFRFSSFEKIPKICFQSWIFDENQ